MIKYKRHIFLSVLLLIALSISARAQSFGPAPSDITVRQRLINWLPEDKPPQRFTLAIRPLHVINFGLKADFEFELNKIGKWLQFSLAGYYTPQYEHSKYLGDYRFYDYDDGWEGPMSGGEVFEKLGGAGLGVAYKSMLSNSGWYWSAGLNFTYYSLKQWIDEHYYYYDERGNEIRPNINNSVWSQIYQLDANVNIGKHFALRRNMFLDVYVGVGWRQPFVTGFDNWFLSFGMYSFQYKGLYINNGIRLGWLLSNKK
jgi:hypothetical protein